MGQTELLLAFIIYLIFFGWIGYRRGTRRELTVFLVAFFSWLLLLEKGDIFVRIANLGSKFMAFIRAGGLGENPDEAFGAISDATPWVTQQSASGFLFLIWVVILVLTYWFTSAKIPSAKSRRDGWAILLGVLNGLFYASVFLPRLLALAFGLAGSAAGTPLTTPTTVPTVSFFGLLANGVRLILNSLASLWLLIAPQRPMAILLLITLLLLIASLSIRRSAGAKS